MKYKGKKVEGRNSAVLVLERGDENIVFIAQAVDSSESEFDDLVKMPEPPEILRPGGLKEFNRNDSAFRKAIEEYATLKTSYMIVMSLKESPDLEWETIQYDKPSTWKNWEKELKDAGFTEVERLKVLQTVMRANSLDDDLLEQARSDFLQDRVLQEK